MLLKQENLSEEILRIFRTISHIAGDQPTFVVGGFPRDYLLGIPNSDLDIVTIGSGCELAKKFCDRVNGQIKVFKNFGTAHVKVGDVDVEFVGARKESYNRYSRNPVVEDGNFEDDRKRRDFCCNSIYVSLNQKSFLKIVDPNGGVKDIKKKLIRTPINPDITFFDDPLRMLRAVRFAAKLGFIIEPCVILSIKANRDRLSILSKERITTELNKILMSSNPMYGIDLLESTGLLKVILPELSSLNYNGTEDKHHKNIYVHSVKVLGQLCKKSGNLWLRWAALLHDIGKDSTRVWDHEKGWTFYGHETAGECMVEKIFTRLKLPIKEMKYVKLLVRLHMRPSLLSTEEITDSAVRRLVFDAEGHIEDLMLLASSDLTTNDPDKRERLSKHYVRLEEMIKDLLQRDYVREFRPVIQGREIMKHYGIGPSDALGKIKEKMKELILDGKLENTEEALYKWLDLVRPQFLI